MARVRSQGGVASGFGQRLDEAGTNGRWTTLCLGPPRLRVILFPWASHPLEPTCMQHWLQMSARLEKSSREESSPARIAH